MSIVTQLPADNSHFISVSTAVDMTTTYRAEKENILASAYQNQDILPLSETFNRNALDTLLALEGCEGIRIYYGMDENLKVHAILVGVTEENTDILPSVSLTETEDEFVVEIGQRCPVDCPPGSVLNS